LDILQVNSKDVSFSVLIRQICSDEAEPVLRSCLLLREGCPPIETLDVASVLLELALLLEMKGKLEEGEEAARRALVIRERILGSQHPDVGVALLGMPPALPLIKQLLYARQSPKTLISRS